MNEILNTRFFSLLAEPSQEVTHEEMQSAYGNFVEYVKAVSSESDYTKAYRNLSFTRIELSALEPILRYEQGEKCPKKCVL